MKKLTAILAVAAIGSVSAALAQSVPGIDLQSIRDRSAAQEADAKALAAEVTRRAEAFREQAVEVEKAALEQVSNLDPNALPKGPKGPIDFDEIVQYASANLKDQRGAAPLFMTFVSLSMPEQALKRAIADTSAAGGVVVFRGFPNNSAKQFLAAIDKVVTDKQYASIGIDPRLFRAFDVQAVPAYVVAGAEMDLCDGLDCVSAPPPHAKMIGNVTVGYALRTFVEDNGPGAKVARVALQRLEADRQ